MVVRAAMRNALTSAVSVRMAQPLTGQTITGVVDLHAAASNVSGVSFWVGTFLVGEALQQGAMWVLEDVNSAAFPNGTYILEARAVTATGTLSDSVSVSVSNTSETGTTPTPDVVMTYPLDAGHVYGDIVMKATVATSLSATKVEFETGRPERTPYAATKSGTTWTSSLPWKSSLVRDESASVVNDYRCSIRAKVTTPTGIVYSEYVYVITRNQIVADAVTCTWNEAYRWAADYTTLSAYVASFKSFHGEGATTIVNDPKGVHGKVAYALMPDDYTRADQPDTPTSVRWQVATRSELGIGSLSYFGFAFMPDANFPTMYGYSDPLDPDYPDYNGTGHVAIAQFYGSPYNRGPGFALDARVEYDDDTYNEFRMSGNAMNPGDPGKLFGLPYHRMDWTDVVFGVAASTDILKGWMEVYVREPADGAGSPLRKLSMNGQTRLQRVLMQLTSPGNRFDNQIYRRLGEFASVGCYFAKQKIGASASEVDPHSR